MQKSARKKRITPVQIVQEEETEQLQQPQASVDLLNANNFNKVIEQQQQDQQLPKQQLQQQQQHVPLQATLPIQQHSIAQQQLLPMQQPTVQKIEEVDMCDFDESTSDYTQNPWLMIKVDLSDCTDGILDWKTEMKNRGVNWSQINTNKSANRLTFQSTLNRLEIQNMEISEDEEMQGDESENIDNTSDNENNIAEGNNNANDDRKRRKKELKANEYDYEDGFLDDSSVFKHLNREKLKTKYEGFFVNQGAIETVSGKPDQGTSKQKKGTNKTAKRKAGGDEQEGVGQKKRGKEGGGDQTTNTNAAGLSEIQGVQKNKEQDAQQQQSASSVEEDFDQVRPTSAESNQPTNEEEQNGGKNEGAGPSKEARNSKKQAKEFEIPDDLLISIKEIEKVAGDLPPPDPSKKVIRCPDPIVKELTNLTPLYYQTCGTSTKAKEKVVTELMKTLEPWFKDNKKLKTKLSELQRKDGKDETQIEVSKTDLQNTLRGKSEQLRKQQEHWDEQVQEKVQRYVDCLLKAGKQVDWNLLVGIWTQENLTVDVKFLQGKVRSQSQQQQLSQTQAVEGEN